MSFGWFAFNIKDFLANTKRLNTEAKGAYLCLMLDYYEQGYGPPDDDEVLATIAELPIDAWRRHRRVIEPLFIVEAGRWRHERIEREMLEAKHKHEAAVARASAGGRARAVKMRDTRTVVPSIGQSLIDSSLRCAPSTLQDSLEVPQSTITLDSLSARANRDLKAEVPVPPEPAPETSMGTPIDRGFMPTQQVMERISADADASTVQLEIQKFIFHHLENGAWSCDWQASFEKWWARFIEHHKKFASKPRAAPRIEVNTTAEPAAIDWDRHLARWRKSQSLWSRKLCGPEPGQIGCRAPVEKLIEFNIDPTTGIVGIAKVDG